MEITKMETYWLQIIVFNQKRYDINEDYIINIKRITKYKIRQNINRERKKKK